MLMSGTGHISEELISQPLALNRFKRADMRQRRELGAQHLMRAQGRHLLFEFVGRVDPAGPHIGDDVVVDMLEIAELLVEMARQQQRGVVELALGDLERALADTAGRDSRCRA